VNSKKQAEALLKVLRQWLDKTDKFIKEMEQLGVKVRIRMMIDVTPEENSEEGLCNDGT